MGLGQMFLRDLIELKRGGALDGARRVVEIGAQQMADSFLTAPELEEACRLFGCPSFVPPPHVGAENFVKQAPLARPFWTAMGFDHAAIDIDDNAIHLDLNGAETPDELRGVFDLAVNTGTTEHVANQENAFRVIHDLMRVGGVMYHEVPAGGMIGHGFFSYQPGFFARLAEQNDYQMLMWRLYASGPSPVPEPFRNQYGVGDTAVDFTLRVAMKKQSRYPFSSPVDAAPHLVPKPRISPSRRLKLALRAIKDKVKRRRAR